jgi:hypothetical protein
MVLPSTDQEDTMDTFAGSHRSEPWNKGKLVWPEGAIQS